MRLKPSRLFVTVLLFLACAALVSLIQAQSEEAPNKCSTDWDFCNSGTEEENAYYWQLGWCAAAIESGAVEASPSACMSQPEGTVTFPPSSRRQADASGEDVPINPEGNNACYDWGDMCSSGTEEENEYHWQLGWCVYAVHTRSTWASVDACMGQPEGTVSYPAWSAPAALVNPSPPQPKGMQGPPPPKSAPNPERPRWQNQPPIPEGYVCLEWSSSGTVCWTITRPLPPGAVCTHRRGLKNDEGEFIWNECLYWAFLEVTEEP